MANLLNNIKSGIESFAPTIATALGGPLAGAAVEAISTAIFGHSDATTDEINKSLQSITPEIALKLKEAEQTFLLESKKLDIEHDSLPYEDVKDARQSDVEMTKSTGKRDYMRPVLAYIMVIGFFVTLLMVAMLILYKVEIEPSISILLGGLIAQITLEVKNIYNFYFGSSEGSKQKDAIIYKGPLNDK